jgi:adenylate kinase
MVKKLVIVMGHSGSGKNSLVASVQRNTKYKIVNLGELMHELAIKKNLVENQDQMKELDEDVRENLRNEAVRRVSKMDGNIILDTHTTVEQHGRFLPGLHHYLVDQLSHASGFLYVDADPDIILKRTNKDKKEKWFIGMQRDINLAILSYHAALLGIPLYVVSNNDDNFEEAQDQVSKHLESIFTA